MICKISDFCDDYQFYPLFQSLKVKTGFKKKIKYKHKFIFVLAPRISEIYDEENGSRLQNRPQWTRGRL